MSKKIKYTEEPMRMGERLKDILPPPWQLAKRESPTEITLYEIARANEEIAQKALVIRTKANATQHKLATRVGVPVETISRLENANYEGDALRLLGRIAYALNKRMVIRFVSIPPPKVRGASHGQSLSL